MLQIYTFMSEYDTFATIYSNDHVTPMVETSSHVMPAWACAMAGIYGCGRIQQPCHPHAGMCGGMGSMAAVTSSSAAMSCLRWLVRRRASMAATYHCHPSYHENPTLHIGVN